MKRSRLCCRQELSDSKAEACSLREQLQAHQQSHTQTTSSFEQQQAAAALQHEQQTQHQLQQQQLQHNEALQLLQQQHQAETDSWTASQRILQGTAAELQGRLDTALLEATASQVVFRSLQKEVCQGTHVSFE